MRIDPGADRGAADRQPAHALQAVLDARLRGIQLRRPRAEFLRHRQRHRVHQMRAAGLDDLAERFRALVDGLAQVAQRRQQVLPGALRAITRSAVGTTSLLLWPRLTWSLGWIDCPEAAAASVGDDLVGIHVAGGAGAGLVTVDRELPVVRATGDGRGGLDDGNRPARARATPGAR
jgi:hypothetical protein